MDQEPFLLPDQVCYVLWMDKGMPKGRPYVEGVAEAEGREQGRLSERVLTDEKGTIILSVQMGEWHPYKYLSL